MHEIPINPNRGPVIVGIDEPFPDEIPLDHFPSSHRVTHQPHGDPLNLGILNSLPHTDTNVHPLSEHSVVDRTKTLLENILKIAHDEFDPTEKNHKQNLADIKAHNIASGIIMGVGALAFLFGVATVAVLWPLGLVLIVVGGTIFAGGAKRFSEVKQDLSKEDLQKLEQKFAKLDKIEKFMGENSTKTLADGTSFEQFLLREGPPPNDNGTYDLDVLVNFITVFEKILNYNQIQTSVKTQIDLISYTETEQETLTKCHITSNIQQATINEINEGKITRAQRKLEINENKQIQILKDLEGLGVTTMDTVTSAKETQKNEYQELKSRLKVVEVEMGEQAQELSDLKEQIKNKTSQATEGLANYIQSKFQKTARSEQIALLNTEIAELEEEMGIVEEDLKKLKTERKDLLNKIEKNTDTLITQKLDTLEKTKISIKALENSIAELNKKFPLNPIHTLTAAQTVAKLKSDNLAKQFDIQKHEDQDIFEGQTIKAFKAFYPNQTYDEVIQEFISDSIEKQEAIARLNEKKLELQTSLNNENSKSKSSEIEKEINTVNKLIIANNKTIESNNNLIDKLTPISQLEKELKENNKIISDLAPIVRKEDQIRLLLNPHAHEIDIHKTKLITETHALKVKGFEDLSAVKEEIQRLIVENARLTQLPENPIASEQREITLQIAKNKYTIRDLQNSLTIINQSQKAVDRLYDQITPTQEEIASDLLELKKTTPEIPYSGEDLRAGNLALKKWQDKQILSKLPKDPDSGLPTAQLNLDATQAISIFGTHNSTPIVQKRDPKYVGLGILNDHNLIAAGRTDKNNFLSNAYKKTLEIDGVEYQSVMHYMLLKKIENERTKLKIDKPPGVEQKLEGLKILANRIKRCATAYEANEIAQQYYHVHYVVFDGMDKELKKALFFKFVGPDGKPNEEGKMLLTTGKAELYAGNEIGDPSYGMQFITRGRMEGQNKLGICLMELRETLRKTEKKSNEYARLTGFESKAESLSEVEDLYDSEEDLYTDIEARKKLAGISHSENFKIIHYPDLSKFEGIEEEKKRKKGTFIYPDGSMYIGKFIDDKPGEPGTDGSYFPAKI